MFKPKTLKITSYIAMICCIVGASFEILIIYFTPSARAYISLVSWSMLIYASYLGIKLSQYDLYAEDLRRLGYYVYSILVLFVLFILFNLSMGIVAAGYLTYTLHVQKRGFDTWIAEQQTATETSDI